MRPLGPHKDISVRIRIIKSGAAESGCGVPDRLWYCVDDGVRLVSSLQAIFRTWCPGAHHMAPIFDHRPDLRGGLAARCPGARRQFRGTFQFAGANPQIWLPLAAICQFCCRMQKPECPTACSSVWTSLIAIRKPALRRIAQPLRPALISPQTATALLG